jgi:hypothetical protein
MRREIGDESNHSISFSFNLKNRENNKGKENNMTSPSQKADGGGIQRECEKQCFGSQPVNQLSTTEVGEQVDIREEIISEYRHFPDLPQFQPGKSVDYDNVSFGGEKSTKNIFLLKQFYYIRISPKFLLDGTSEKVRKDGRFALFSVCQPKKSWLTKRLTKGGFNVKKEQGRESRRIGCEVCK